MYYMHVVKADNRFMLTSASKTGTFPAATARWRAVCVHVCVCACVCVWTMTDRTGNAVDLKHTCSSFLVPQVHHSRRKLL